MKEENGNDMAAEVTQCECNNIKCYALTFSNIYICGGQNLSFGLGLKPHSLTITCPRRRKH